MDAHEYNARVDEITRHKPAACPGCASQRLNWHGWYPRWAMYVAADVRLAGVRRLLCKGCGHTISLLPSFLHRCRHYALGVIRAVVEERVERPRPWAPALARPFACTKRRWVKALAVTTWLPWLLQTLAAVKPSAPELDAHGNTPTFFGLLRSLASWLEPRSAAWHVVWRTGWNAGVGRLV